MGSARLGGRWKSGAIGSHLENICRDRLGVNFHGLRHTFARTMEHTGANVSEIQSRLGHSSLQTTGRYLVALRLAENSHAEQLAVLLGLGRTFKKLEPADHPDDQHKKRHRDC